VLAETAEAKEGSKLRLVCGLFGVLSCPGYPHRDGRSKGGRRVAQLLPPQLPTPAAPRLLNSGGVQPPEDVDDAIHLLCRHDKCPTEIAAAKERAARRAAAPAAAADASSTKTAQQRGGPFPEDVDDMTSDSKP